MTLSRPKLFLQTLQGEPAVIPPVWLMRQAGRYLPEYREIRAKADNFIGFCHNPTLASEATLQPIRRFGFDAAILFSDILVVPPALGQHVSFESGEGPRLDPIQSPEDLLRLKPFAIETLEPVFETIDRVKGALPSQTALIGFCGAPWTVASYMIAGHGTPDQAPARLFAYRYPDAFQKLIDLLTQASIDYLDRQFDAGVEAVQIFDSWAGVLPEPELNQWCVQPITAIIKALRQKRPSAPIIAFPRGVSTALPRFYQEAQPTAIGLDTSLSLEWAHAQLPSICVTQGNLDPLALLAGGTALEKSVRHIKDCLSKNPRPHIFNLGHGILPQTPIEHVETMLKLLRSN